jgi:ABC-2 type transport system ATP-binding protein
MADRIGIINHGKLLLVEEKAALMQKLGRKQLILQLDQPLTRVPESLVGYGLELANAGCDLIYTYDREHDRAGIPELLKAVAAAGLTFKDLHTSQSSLEDIFVHMVSERQ